MCVGAPVVGTLLRFPVGYSCQSRSEYRPISQGSCPPARHPFHALAQEGLTATRHLTHPDALVFLTTASQIGGDLALPRLRSSLNQRIRWMAFSSWYWLYGEEETGRDGRRRTPPLPCSCRQDVPVHPSSSEYNGVWGLGMRYGYRLTTTPS